MFFCNFSKAFASTCRTRSRLIPNSEPSSSNVAALSDKRRFWIIYCSLGFNFSIAAKRSLLLLFNSSLSAYTCSWFRHSSTNQSCHSPSDSADLGAFSEWSGPESLAFILITSCSGTSKRDAISLTFSGERSPSSIAFIWPFNLRKLKNSFF